MFCPKWSDRHWPDSGSGARAAHCPPRSFRPSVHVRPSTCASFATRHELGISHATHSASVRPLFRRQRRRRVKRASGPQPRAGERGGRSGGGGAVSPHSSRHSRGGGNGGGRGRNTSASFESPHHHRHRSHDACRTVRRNRDGRIF